LRPNTEGLHAVEQRASNGFDFREHAVFTIDSISTQDMDDALHITRSAAGWEVGVHITDVSHHVREGSPLDMYAQGRGNTTYLPSSVNVGMFPDVLVR
jgi:exoribonuclease R